MPAVTVTDHGSMAGAVELYRTATKAGIKPIVGCEVYLVDDRFQKEARGERSWAHLTLLAEDTSRLPQPRQARHDRLPRGLPLQAARRLRPAAAVLGRADRAHRLPVGPRLQGAARRRPAACPRRARPARPDLRPRPGLHRDPGRRHRRAPPGQPGPAASWPTRPACPRSAPATSTTCAPRMPTRTRRCSASRPATSSSNPKRFRFENKQFFFKTPDEMARDFAPYGRELLRPTLEIAERCNVEIELGTIRLPRSTCPAARTPSRTSRGSARPGWPSATAPITPELQQRARSSSCRPSARWASPTTS